MIKKIKLKKEENTNRNEETQLLKTNTLKPFSEWVNNLLSGVGFDFILPTSLC